jgi:predicted component of type VI protein secretion system
LLRAFLRSRTNLDAYLEVWENGGAQLAPLVKRTTIGRAQSNGIVVSADPTVSRIHAVIEDYEIGWAIRDVGAANGTFVNDERVESERILHHGDEIRLGGTRLVYRAGAGEEAAGTLRDEQTRPIVTNREHDVLVALCRPLASSKSFAQPATVVDIARELVVSEAAVKFHLSNLYAKFLIEDPGPNRRAELANAAIDHGAVSRADLRTSRPSH